MSTTYHTNGRIKWSSLGSAYHDNGSFGSYYARSYSSNKQLKIYS
ncbi:hypothetical protein [Flavobacterium acetivorans]|nr:hypothetical protein [Flavobacterium sp. F-29]